MNMPLEFSSVPLSSLLSGFLMICLKLRRKQNLPVNWLRLSSLLHGAVYKLNSLIYRLFGQFDFGYLSIPITIIWIIGITNAINLIDGLDGLAAGVSTIALITIAVMAMIMGNVFVVATAAILAASSLGFLFFNFHPAKIFMGDTGSLFLGFMISVLALLGFKNVAVVSLIIPVIMLGSSNF